MTDPAAGSAASSPLIVICVGFYLNPDTRSAIVGVRTWDDPTIRMEQSLVTTPANDLGRERLFLRELAPITRLIDAVVPRPVCILVDGYCTLDQGRPGFGRELYDHYAGAIPVIGVAKKPYRGAPAEEVVRHGRKPLYVTAVGMTLAEAAANVQAMHGTHRVPEALRSCDQLARAGWC